MNRVATTRVSLIISTYNWVSALTLVLDSVKRQTRLPDEVVIADDGSDNETADAIKTIKSTFPVPLIHAFQTDEGFRAARSRNNAVKQSSGDYLICIDGDTILHPKFVSDHLALSEQGSFCVGSRVLLSEIATQDFLTELHFDFSWWKTAANNKQNAIWALWIAKYYAKAKREPFAHWIFKVRSCNMGIFRTDYEAINGFNHEFQGWGREDSEFALRLFKKGLSMRRLKFSAIQYHLYHQENERSRLDINDSLIDKALETDNYRCSNGLSTLPEQKYIL